MMAYPLMPALERQGRVDPCEFKASLVYIASQTKKIHQNDKVMGIKMYHLFPAFLLYDSEALHAPLL